MLAWSCFFIHNSGIRVAHLWHTGGTLVAHTRADRHACMWPGPPTDVPICPVTKSCFSSGRSERKHRFSLSAKHVGKIGVSAETSRCGGTCAVDLRSDRRHQVRLRKERKARPAHPGCEKIYADIKLLFSCVLVFSYRFFGGHVQMSLGFLGTSSHRCAHLSRH